MTKRIISIFMLLIMAFTLSGCDNIMWGRYSYPTRGFSVLLPRFWNREIGFQNTALVARSPLSGNEDKFQENVTIVTGDLPEEVDLDELFEMNKAEILKALPGAKYNVIEQEIFAGRHEGRVLAFDNKVKDYSLRITSAIWVRNKRIYVITCTGELKNLEKYESAFKRVMESIRLK